MGLLGKVVDAVVQVVEVHSWLLVVARTGRTGTTEGTTPVAFIAACYRGSITCWATMTFRLFFFFH